MDRELDNRHTVAGGYPFGIRDHHSHENNALVGSVSAGPTRGVHEVGAATVRQLADGVTAIEIGLKTSYT